MHAVQPEPLCGLAAEASERTGLEWSIILGTAFGQCSSRVGIWSGAREALTFVPLALTWNPDELIAAHYGKCLLEKAMAEPSEIYAISEAFGAE